MVFQGLFFDAAGTLFELAEPVGLTYARAAESRGLALDPEILETAFRRAWKASPPPLHPEGRSAVDDDRSWWFAVARATFESAAGGTLDTDQVRAIFDDLYEHYAEARAWRLFPDVMPALDRFAEIAPLHILSNFDLRLHRILSGLGIAGRFQTVTVSSQAGASKPHARIFRHALQAAGIPARSALHIGNESKADISGATLAGMSACLIRRPGLNLQELAEKLITHDDSCLHAPVNRVVNPPQIERG